MRGFVLTALLAGCGFGVPGDNSADDGDDSDAPPIDAPADPDAPPCATFSSLFDTCLLAAGPPSTVTLDGSYEFNTDTGEFAPAVVAATAVVLTPAGSVRAILVERLELLAGASVRATGTLPLAIVAHGQVTLGAGAVLDVSAGGAGTRAACEPPAMRGTDDAGGASGGGGGGNAAGGGAGGEANSDGAAVFGGAGGGAVYIAAGAGLLFAEDSVLDAGGAGGGGGRQDSSHGDAGGGGGGAGGMIFLEAPSIQAGILVANGGGGGEGSGNFDPGNPGAPGTRTADAAPGGRSGSGTGTDGGSGGHLGSLAGASPSGPQAGGSGGGGGAAGFIRILSHTTEPMLGPIVSPGPTLD